MFGRSISITGRLAVVWCVTASGALAKVCDLAVNDHLLYFEVMIDIEDKEVWVLDEGPAGIRLSWYRSDGGESHLHVPSEPNMALDPRTGVPPCVWARAVLECHERHCHLHQNGCGYVEMRHWLEENGLLA